MSEGQVVLSEFVQADGQTKSRPAIVLRVMPRFSDLLVCGVSRQLRLFVPNFDEIIETTDADFPSSGLVDRSLIRLGFLGLLPQSDILATIGSISTERHQRLLTRLADYLKIGTGKP